MGLLRYIFLAALLWVAAAISAVAQEDDKGFLTRTLQDALSGAGRAVSIDGFQGALSSSASFDRMTISDAEGVWLTLEEVALVWNRSALLRGRLEVETLTAKRLDVPRLPVAEEAALPDAEAGPFSLPDLPVSIEIAEFAVDQIALGAPIIGQAVALRVAAAAAYTDDAARIDFQAERTDGQAGEFAIEAELKRDDNLLDLLIKLQEGADGIAANLLSIPGRPTVDLEVAGSGPLEDFNATVAFSTDGAPRLAGEIGLGTQTPRRASATPDRRITADVGGDITAVLAPRYRAFFGTDVRLTLDALVEGNGAVEVSDFGLRAQAARLAGQVRLNQEGWPVLLKISGDVGNGEETPVLLPVGGEGTTVKAVTLDVDYDAANDDALRAAFDVAELSLSDVQVGGLALTLDGTLQGDVGRIGEFAGLVGFEASGLGMSNPALLEAIGQAVSGQTQLRYVEGNPLEIADLVLRGIDYGLTGQATVGDLVEGGIVVLDVQLTADDLSRFSGLAGRELDGAAELALAGDVGILSGQFDLAIDGATQDIRTGIAQADALLAGRTGLSTQARRDETGTFLRDLVLQNAALDFTGAAELRSDNSRVQADVRLVDVGLIVPQYTGPVTISGTALQDTQGWSVDVATEGPYGVALTLEGPATGPAPSLAFTADVPDVAPFAEGVEGPVQAEGVLRQTEAGWEITTQATGPYAVQAAVEGALTPTIDIAFDLSAPDVNPVVPQLSGPVQARGRLAQTAEGYRIETTASGPYGARAAVQGALTPALDISYDLTVPNVQPLVPQVNGPLSAVGTLRQTDKGFVVDTSANGPYGARAELAGLATGPEMALTFALGLPDVSPLAPGVRGPLQADGTVRQTPAGIAVDVDASGPYASQVAVDGVVTGDQPAVNFNGSMPNIGVLVEQITGPLSLSGSARQVGASWQIDTDVAGPSGTTARVDGTAGTDGQLNLAVVGQAPLGLSRPFLAPRNLQGQARFDLRVDGPAALSSVSGTIRADGASLTAPNLRIALRDIGADVQLARSRAQVNVTGSAVEGGRLSVAGGVTLTGSIPADLQIGIDGLVVQDPSLYRTTLDGGLRVAGPLTGGAVISGQIAARETNVNVPSTGLTSIGDIPAIQHIGAPAAVHATQARAGVESARAGGVEAEAQGAGYGLNLRVDAPSRIFVRGRGLDAELGGGLTLTGSTNRVISAGRFSLIRGRLDILGQRFDLSEGSIQFQGDLVPYIRFVTSTSTSTGEVRVVVEGPADAPEVSFESSPEAPQDEVLAQLLFGRSLSDISPFQALQLANAVATLAGRQGIGVIGNLRDGFGLDDLDVTTTDSGATAVRAGKYLTENVYSDVTAASDGTGEVSLNLDLTPNLTGKATLDSTGNSGIGIFFEKDY